MVAAGISVLLFALAVLGVLIFSISGIIHFLKREPANDDWERAIIFLILAVIFFFMIGIIALLEDVPEVQSSESKIEEEIIGHHDEVHHPSHHKH